MFATIMAGKPQPCVYIILFEVLIKVTEWRRCTNRVPRFCREKSKRCGQQCPESDTRVRERTASAARNRPVNSDFQAIMILAQGSI
jgi:hypothetical protein